MKVLTVNLLIFSTKSLRIVKMPKLKTNSLRWFLTISKKWKHLDLKIWANRDQFLHITFHPLMEGWNWNRLNLRNLVQIDPIHLGARPKDSTKLKSMWLWNLTPMKKIWLMILLFGLRDLTIWIDRSIKEQIDSTFTTIELENQNNLQFKERKAWSNSPQRKNSALIKSLMTKSLPSLRDFMSNTF